MREAGRWAALLFFLETGPYGTAREGGPRRGPRALRAPSAEAVNTAKHCRQQRAHPCWHVSIAEDAGHSDRRMQGTVAPTVNGTCFPQEPASPRIGLRRTTRRGCPAPDARLPLETCRVAFGLWSSSVCGENASLPLQLARGVCKGCKGCRGVQRGCTVTPEGSAAQGSDFCGIESSTAIPLCQHKGKFGIAKLPSQNVREGQIQWPTALGAATGRLTRPSVCQGRTEHVHTSATINHELEVQRSIVAWLGMNIFFYVLEGSKEVSFSQVPKSRDLGGSGSCKSQGRESHANQTAGHKVSPVESPATAQAPPQNVSERNNPEEHVPVCQRHSLM